MVIPLTVYLMYDRYLLSPFTIHMANTLLHRYLNETILKYNRI